MQEIATAKLGQVSLQPVLTIDAELELEDVDWALQDNLARLEPTGYANATPIFLSRGLEVVSRRVVGQDGAHLQMRLSGPYSGNYGYKELPAIAFRQAEWANCLPQYVDVVYTIGVNEWRGNRSLQLMVQDIRPSSR
jgi:single-stranded-DNA-specific exonuclease